METGRTPRELEREIDSLYTEIGNAYEELAAVFAEIARRKIERPETPEREADGEESEVERRERFIARVLRMKTGLAAASAKETDAIVNAICLETAKFWCEKGYALGYARGAGRAE